MYADKIISMDAGTRTDGTVLVFVRTDSGAGFYGGTRGLYFLICKKIMKSL